MTLSVATSIHHKISSAEELFLPHTPIESYNIGNRHIDVKREDMYCRDMIAPLAKMRGVHVVMEKMKSDGIDTVGVFDFKVSKAGVGISAMANLLGIRCIECYQHYKAYNGKELPAQQQMCQSWGAELYPIKASRININYAVGRRYVLEQGGYMFPKGIILDETIDSVAYEVSHDAETLSRYDHLVINVGSGTIVTGLLKGLLENGLRPHVHAVSCTDSTIHCKKLYDYLDKLPVNECDEIKLDVYPAAIEYYSESTVECPFPSHPNYDRKAWQWLLENIDQLDGEILFWNIGA
ncbi:MAG: 1-aminocyclopropane-1-carboxylate deaminase [Desulforhopalus sp.]|jgi:1-aminocyclopropane-1-carboxylate deaminase/D-cysteine desulfhydrase-like pyridoxal-dependent ACC family enzyme